ncbi:MAG TPA: glycosyltransferase family 39 protein, partial [Verrucomicrobiae bacterium]|nr:glycosyltransferase family 39 protein [Verrucomicrobiae bacterium]
VSVAQVPADHRGTKPGLAAGWILCFALAKLAVHLVTIAFTPYGIHRDEFLYLAMGEHLRFWGMDFPPAIALISRFTRWMFGDTLFAVRFFPALAGTGILVLTAALTRELGGRRLAQVLAMVALLFCPLFIRPSVLLQPVVWDQLWWTLGFYAFLRVLAGGGRKWWALVGVAGGLGLLTKFSILFFALGVLTGILCCRSRSMLATYGPWLAAAIALVLGSPTLVGQVRLHFPVVIHMADLRHEQLSRVTAGEFLSGQVWMLGLALLLALIGLVWLLRQPALRPAGLTCAVAFLVIMLLQGKPYYVGPIYPFLFAAGAAALDRWNVAWARAIQTVLLAVFVLTGLPALPFGLPILPPPLMARYCQAVGLKAAVTTNRGHLLSLPQDYADMLGWEAQVQAVSRVFESLSPGQKAAAGLIARNYGEAGALEFYGNRYGLPRRIMLPNNDLLWPADQSCSVVVAIGIPAADLSRFFQHGQIAARFDDPWMVEEERDRVIAVADTPKRDLREAWRHR